MFLIGGLGFLFYVLRQENGGASPPDKPWERSDKPLLLWECCEFGKYDIHWMDDIVKAGQAIDLGGNGYPYFYSIQTKRLIPMLLEERMHVYSYDSGECRREASDYDQYLSEHKGTTLQIIPGWTEVATKDLSVLDGCREDEWLLLECWDKS